MKLNKNKISRDYCEEYDLLGINFGGEVKHSREFRNISVIFDFDKNDDIVGLEIIDFMEAVKRSDKEVEEIFSIRDKQTPYKKAKKALNKLKEFSP